MYKVLSVDILPYLVQRTSFKFNRREQNYNSHGKMIKKKFKLKLIHTN